MTGALTPTKERMPLKGESRFFLLDFFIFQYPGRSLPLLSSPLAGPLPHCYAGRVGPKKFPRRSPNFLLPAKARVGGRRSASRSSAELQAGGWLCTSASAAGALGERLGCWAPPQTAALGFSASKSSRTAEKDEEAPPCPRPRRAATGDAFVQPGPEPASRERPTSRLSAPPPASPRSGFVQDSPGHRTARSTRAPKGHHALRQPEPCGWAPRPCAGGHEGPRASAGREGSH